MSVNPYESPDTPGKPQEQRRSGCRSVLVTFVSVVVIPTVFVLFCVLPNMRFSTGAARRSQCRNNLKQIGLALHLYHQDHGSLPPAYTVDAEGNRLHSWRTLILPYLEQKALYDKIDLDKPWDDPANKEVFEASVPTYLCPSMDVPKGHTTYVAVVAPDGCFRAERSRALDEITDGTGQTLMVVELDASRAVPWMSPRDADPQTLIAAAKAEKLPHQGVVQAAFADGSVKALRSDLSPAQWRSIISIAANDTQEADAAMD
jgi:prepilin-type processing-associated H-X9-DG protein